MWSVCFHILSTSRTAAPTLPRLAERSHALHAVEIVGRTHELQHL
jgi:hypothetical protein